VNGDETATDAEPSAERRASPADSASQASGSETSIEPGGPKPAVHWLARVAERAELDGKSPAIAPETEAKEAWAAVTRAYKIEDSRLCELVASGTRSGRFRGG